MPETEVLLRLRAGEGEEVEGKSLLIDVAPKTRCVRSAGILVGAALSAALFLPIPIIHFFAPPAILIAGLVLATRQFRVRARLEPIHLPCPKCGASVRVGGGLGMHDALAPLVLRCESCRRMLTAAIDTLPD